MNAPAVQIKLDARISKREPHLKRTLSAGEDRRGGRPLSTFSRLGFPLWARDT